MATRKSLAALDLKKVLSGAQLPALPQSAIRLLEISRDPENGPAEFAAPIEADPGLTSQVLRFVNSSYFGFSREISSVKLAISLVGVRTIKNFALWSAVFSLMPNPKCGPFDLKSLWQDSLRRALFARALAKIQGMKVADDVFAAALLQDMAIPLLAKESPDVYVELLRARQKGDTRLSSMEEERFGWTHAEAAGMIARHWNLPEQFAALIEGHTAATAMVTQGEREPGKLAVAMSAFLPSTVDPRWTEHAAMEACYQQVVPPGSITLPELLAQIDDEFTQFAPMLKISSPSKSLGDRLEEVAALA